MLPLFAIYADSLADEFSFSMKCVKMKQTNLM